MLHKQILLPCNTVLNPKVSFVFNMTMMAACFCPPCSLWLPNPSGQYQDSDGRCHACDATCLKCTGPRGQDCISCSSSRWVHPQDGFDLPLEFTGKLETQTIVGSKHFCTMRGLLIYEPVKNN